MQTIRNFINGRFADPQGGAWLDNCEPAVGAVYSRVADSDERDIAAAVAAAKNAFPAWSAAPSTERSRVLLRLADLIDRDREKLARAESIDTGKPIALARTVDIPRAAANMRFFATAILHESGEFFETDMPAAPTPGAASSAQAQRALNYTLRRPRGVAGCISPWNLPLYLFTWKIAPALATGNTVVGKPSEVTPMTASMLAELSVEAGLPPGVLNIVHGRGDRAGAALVQHPDVPAITFTGSTKVGGWIGETCGRMFKRVSLELGGKNPCIVFADADFDAALETGVRAAFSNQGQICLCGSRMLVQRGIFDRFVEGLVAGARALRIGDPMEDSTRHGAQVSAPHLAKIESYVELARQLGGKIHCGGRRVPADNLPSRCRGGYFFEPTVITGLANDCRVIQEEIFGPVVTVQPFDTEAEAVALANSTPYGLAASLWTGDAGRAHRVAAAIDAGIVWVNCWMLRDLRTPFGGMKNSGIGREGGVEALRFFTEQKTVCVRC